MRDFGVSFERVPLMCDNTSAISVAKNPVFHKRMRHLERRHLFLRDHVENGDIEMRYIDTERQSTLNWTLTGNDTELGQTRCTKVVDNFDTFPESI